jgi:hypothetical protein
VLGFLALAFYGPFLGAWLPTVLSIASSTAVTGVAASRRLARLPQQGSFTRRMLGACMGLAVLLPWVAPIAPMYALVMGGAGAGLLAVAPATDRREAQQNGGGSGRPAIPGRIELVAAGNVRVRDKVLTRQGWRKVVGRQATEHQVELITAGNGLLGTLLRSTSTYPLGQPLKVVPRSWGWG